MIRTEHTLLVRKPHENGPHTRTRWCWKDNIKMDFKEVGCEGME